MRQGWCGFAGGFGTNLDKGFWGRFRGVL